MFPRVHVGLHGLKGRKLGVINCSSIYPRGNDWHNSVTRVSSMCYVQRGMLITCTGKLDAEQLLDKCVEKRSSFIEEAHANLSKTYSRFFKLESPHCGLVNPVSFFRLRNDDVFFWILFRFWFSFATALMENKIISFLSFFNLISYLYIFCRIIKFCIYKYFFLWIFSVFSDIILIYLRIIKITITKYIRILKYNFHGISELYEYFFFFIHECQSIRFQVEKFWKNFFGNLRKCFLIHCFRTMLISNTYVFLWETFLKALISLVQASVLHFLFITLFFCS